MEQEILKKEDIRHQLNIRPFETRDAAAVAQLTAASPETAQWSEQSYSQLLTADRGGYAGWVATGSQGVITGFIITRTIAGDAEILNLAVAAPHRRAGIAGALLLAALQDFARAKVRRVYLEVRAANAGALAFYQKHTFTITGTRPRYYQYPEESAVLIEKILTASAS